MGGEFMTLLRGSHLLLACAAGLLLVTVSHGQNLGTQRFDLFSGVSLQQAAVHGGNASFACKLNSRFSVVADFSAHQESDDGSYSADRLYGLFGGQLALGKIAGFSPFARVTGGISHKEEIKSSFVERSTGAVFGVGGGVDFRGGGLLDLRVLQIDFLTGPNRSQGTDVRYSFGVVLSF